MKRFLYNELINWKNSHKRKPLLLQGARQVGKTYLVNQFGKNEYIDYINLNFEQNSDLKSIFAGELNPHKIIENIGFYIGRKINPENSLILFDEIQEVPEAITSLKYFCEAAPEYHLIAAGSLLGVSVGKKKSFPVGKVNFVTMHPMTFYEYLLAVSEKLLADKLQNYNKTEPLTDLIHNKLINHFKKYLFVGGMPEVLQDFIDNNDIASVRNRQEEILKAYKRDFSKYTDKPQAIKISEVWQSIPYQLAKENKKFKYSIVRKGACASAFEQTIQWLKNAGLVNIAYNISVPKLPLAGYADYSKFKIYLSDSGLLGAMLNVGSDIIIKPTELFTEYNGAFIENYVANELTASGNNELFYWKSRSDAEVDFIIQFQNEVYPLEVKSGLSRNLKSLRSYADKYKPGLIFRTSPRNFVKDKEFINIPLYAVSLIPTPAIKS